MRKLIGLTVLIVTLAIPAAAVAATLSNGNGQTCTGAGTWHFVNNQTAGASAGSLMATFSGGVTVTTGPAAVNQKTQHFFVSTTGGATLLSASTNLPGRLVLSDFACDDDKKDPKK